ncbi:MAG: efflux RND transporter permease subunit, partial [bacterium]
FFVLAARERAVRMMGWREKFKTRNAKLQTHPGSYHRFLALALRQKSLTIFLTLAIFAGSYTLFDKYVTKGRIWSWAADTYLVAYINMPTGAEISRTDEIVKKFEESVVENTNISRVFANVTSDYGRVEITFPEKVQQSAFPLILKEQLTSQAVQIAGPNVGVYGFGPGFYSGGGSAPQFRLQVLGYNYNEVKRIAEDLGRKLEQNPRIREVDTNGSFGYGGRDDLFEMALKVDRQNLKRFHLTTAEVLQQIQSYLRESLDWQHIKVAGKELNYRTKMRGYRDFSIDELKNLFIETSKGEKVRLGEIASIGERKALAEIVREDQQFLRWVSFEYRGPWKFGDRLVANVIKNTKLPYGYKLKRATFFFLTEEEKKQIYWVLAFALLLVYMVTAGLFESLVQPFVVILAVPLALVGVFLIFYLTETNFDRSAYIGVILLAGIVVNNSIILVHHINNLRQKGLAVFDALIQAASDRIRPILMTSATTVLGLLPLVLFSKAEESIWYALSLATIGGLLSSTLLVWVVIPVVYGVLWKVIKSRMAKILC